MLEHIDLRRVLTVDIETAPQYRSHHEVPVDMYKLWEQKSRYQRQEGELAEDHYRRAGIWAEFGKIVCLSMGVFTSLNQPCGIRIKSFYAHDEKEILLNFIQVLNKQPRDLILCAHNGKEFDFPYLCRRMLIQSLTIPEQLAIAGKKPWEIHHIDTMELWKFGDHKHYTSLDLLAKIFNIPTPKDDMCGADVGRVYWEEGDLERIAHYCEKDVLTTAQLLLRFKGCPLIQKHAIITA